MVKPVKPIKLPEFYFSLQVLWLRLTGIEVLKSNYGFPYKIYSAFILMFTSTFLLVEYAELALQSNFNSIVIIGWYAINFSLTMAKVMVIYRHRKEFGDLMKHFHKGFFKPDKIRGGEFEEQCIYKILVKSEFQVWSKYLMKQYGMVILLSCIATLFETIKPRFTQPPEHWTLFITPIPLVDTTRSPTFEIAYIYQAVVVYLITFWKYLCDCTVIAIIAQTTAQLKILEHSVRNFKSRNLKIQGEQEVPACRTLGYIIRHHLTLLQTADKVEYLCSYLVLCVFLANLILLCLVMYYTSLTPIKSVGFFRYLFYSLGVAIQLFLYCWWGNEVILANEALALSIFETYDPDDPIPQSKAVKLMLVKAQKPLFFTAGKFVPLSLDTYKAIIKGSFSYFTVLRKVNSK